VEIDVFEGDLLAKFPGEWGRPLAVFAPLDSECLTTLSLTALHKETL